MAWTTPGTAVAGEVLTAAFWNEQVRDNLNALDAAGANDVGLVHIATAALTGAAVDIQGCFSSDYANYMLITTGYIANDVSVAFRLLSGASVISTNYVTNALRDDGSTLGRATNTTYAFASLGANNGFGSTCTVFTPAQATKTFFSGNFFSTSGASSYTGHTATQHTLSTAYDGIRILPTSGDFSSGSLRVYGIRD